MTGRILLAGLFAATLVLAQGRGGGGMGGGMGDTSGTGGGGMGGGGDRGGGMGGGMGASRPSRFDMMGQLLKLNNDQKKDLKKIMDDGQKEANPIKDQMAKGRTTLGDALQAGKSDDDLKPLIASEAALESQMAGVEINAFAKIFKILDKDQQANTRTLFQMMKGVFSGKNWNSEE